MSQLDQFTPAYLYAMHLDGPGLGWEYLRRNPGYRSDWQVSADPQLARPPELWGLRSL